MIKPILIVFILILNKLINCNIHFYYDITDYSHPRETSDGDYSCDAFGGACDPIFYIYFESGWESSDILWSTEDYQYSGLSSIPKIKSGQITLHNKKLRYLRIKIVDGDCCFNNDYIGTYIFDFNTITFPNKGTYKLSHIRGEKGVSIWVSFTATCFTNYYGVDCLKFCAPSKTFICNSNGDIICKQHYYGNDCLKYCKSDTSYRCDSEGNKICQLSCGVNEQCVWIHESNQFKCDCKTGYYGASCKPINSTIIINNIQINREIKETKNNFICQLSCQPDENCLWFPHLSAFQCICKENYTCNVINEFENRTFSDAVNGTYAQVYTAGISGSLIGVVCFFVILLVAGIAIGVFFGLWYRNKQVFDVFVVWRKNRKEVARVNLCTDNV